MRGGLLAATMVALSLLPFGATASCASPYLFVGDADQQPNVEPGRPVDVQGRAFVSGCDDTGSSNVFGCSTQEGPEVRPYDDVRLTVTQDGRSWALGEQDAGTAEEGELGHVTWRVELPGELQPGPARLVARAPGLDRPARLRITVVYTATPG